MEVPNRFLGGVGFQNSLEMKPLSPSEEAFLGEQKLSSRLDGKPPNSSRKVPEGTRFRNFSKVLLVRASERTLETSMGELWASNRPPGSLQEAGYRERGVCLPGAPGSRDHGSFDSFAPDHP